jgi:hypothetical protein
MGYLTKNDRWLLKYLEDTKSRGITITQAGMMLYPGDVNGYQYMRKRMKILHERKLLQYVTNSITNEYIYFTDKKPPNSHDVLVNNFIANLQYYKCEILEYKEKKYWLDNKIMSDGFVIYKYLNKYKAAFIEMDNKHATDINKYERLYTEGSTIQELGGFPYVVIMSSVDRHYESKNFLIVQLDIKCSEFASKVLSL